MKRALVSFAALLCAGAAWSQAQPPMSAAYASQEMKRLCDTVSMAPADGLEMARRAECVLSGVLSSPDRLREARTLARKSFELGTPAGGMMLYLVFLNDPANQYLKNGRIDPDAYRRLGARTLEQRLDQVEAIEGLGFAAGRGHPGAGLLLAGYFHDTVAPNNVSRVGALTALLLRNGEKHPLVERYAREADTVKRSAKGTKASLRSFLQAYRDASNVATASYREQAAGKSCGDLKLKSVSSGDIQGAEYLPLKGNMVSDSYLVRGKWVEYWTFQGCDQEVPVKVSFEADGWGGSTASASHNKGS